MSKSDELARLILEKLGFKVNKISVSNESGKKMPDFHILYGESDALVEAKLKEDNPEEISRRTKILDDGDVYYSEHVLGRNETLSGIVKKANKQLSADAGINSDFRIIMFIANCINASVVREQFIDTLYGRTEIIEMQKKSARFATSTEIAIFSEERKLMLR